MIARQSSNILMQDFSVMIVYGAEQMTSGQYIAAFSYPVNNSQRRGGDLPLRRICLLISS
jgi:hypothetical protein